MNRTSQNHSTTILSLAKQSLATRATYNHPISSTALRISSGNRTNLHLLYAVCFEKVRELLEVDLNTVFHYQGTLFSIKCSSRNTLAKDVKENLEKIKNQSSASELSLDIKSVRFSPKSLHSGGVILFKIDKQLKVLSIQHPAQLNDFIAKLMSEMESLISNPESHNALNIKLLSDVLSEIRLVKDSEPLKKIAQSFFNTVLNYDNSFVQNGGDSITGIRLISKLRNSGLQLTFTDLMSHIPLKEVFTLITEESIEVPQQGERSASLSFMQKRIFLRESLIKADFTHHEQFTYQLNKRFSEKVVQRSFIHIWQKYKNLRYNYESLLNNSIEYLNIHEYDFRFLKSTTSLQAAQNSDIRLGYAKAMLRLTYISNYKGDSFIIWNHHHMLLDGWSNSILMGKFIENLHSDFESNDQVNEKNDQEMLLDFERTVNSAKTYSYYKKFYSEFTPAYTHFSQTGNPQQKCESDIDASAVELLSKKYNIPSSHVFIGSLFLMLYANYGKTKFFIDVISSGRNIPIKDIDQAVGLFIRNIPLGIEISDEQQGVELLLQVNRQMNESLLYEIIPDDLEENIEVTRSDILFVFENYPIFNKSQSAEAGNLVEYSDRTGYPLTVYIFPSSNLFNIKFVFNENLLSENEASAFLKKYRLYIQALIEKPMLKIKELNLYPPTNLQSQKNTESWLEKVKKTLMSNRIRIGSSRQSECLEGQALEKKLFFFKSLFQTIPSNSVVGVLAKRDENLPLIAYSIMSNGHVYLPINASWPYPRVKECLIQTGCTKVYSDYYTDKLIADKFELISPPVTESLKDNHSAKISENDIAYILFTSGSTGKPKGVCLTHKNLSSFFDAAQQVIDKYSFDSIVALTNIGFDLSIFELLFPLYHGCTVRVIEDLTEMEEALGYSEFNLVNTVPSVIRALEKKSLERIYLLHTAGEVFEKALYENIKRVNPSMNIINWYGPTETTTYSTYIDLTREYSNSIGSPLAYEDLFILDYLGNIQEEFLPGQIVITGEGVSKGYLTDSSDVFYTFAGTSAYATGDFGKKENGLIILLGRKDKQVKKLGQRFNLNELENSIKSSFEGISRIVCEIKDNRIYLFVESEPILERIWNYIKENFPTYMYPDEVIMLDKFPENSNGKVDLTKLIEGLDERETEIDDTTDHNILQEIKKENNFFKAIIGSQGFIQQGGDSLVALRLIGSLKSLGYFGTIESLLYSETVNNWFETLEKNKPSKSTNLSEDNQLTMIQSWFLSSYKGNKDYFNQSLLLRIENNALIDPLVEYMQNIDSVFPIYARVHKYSGWEKKLNIHFEELRISDLSEINSANHRLQTTINLQSGPVFASALFHHTNKAYLLLVIHHLYCDGVTWRILFDQFLSDRKTEYETEKLYALSKTRANADLSLLSDTDKLYFNRNPLNPFKENPGNYKDSLNLSTSFSKEITSTLIRDWKPNASMQKKVFILFMQSWIQVNNDPVSVFMESHGRNASEIENIFDVPGWFTVFYPIHYETPTNDLSSMDAYLEETYNRVPRLIDAYMAINNDKGFPPFPVLLNYLGNFDEGWNEHFTIIDQEEVPQVDPNNERLANIELNSYVKENQFHVEFRAPSGFNLTALVNQFEQFAGKVMANDSINFNAHGDIRASDLSKISQLINK